MDSFEPDEGESANVLDGNADTYWHTEWSKKSPAGPHEIVIDFGKTLPLTVLTYLPRQNNKNGRIGRYEIYVSGDGKNWGKPVKKGQFHNSPDLQKAEFNTPVTGRFIKLRALSEVNGNPWASAAEIGVLCSTK